MVKCKKVKFYYIMIEKKSQMNIYMMVIRTQVDSPVTGSMFYGGKFTNIFSAFSYI